MCLLGHGKILDREKRSLSHLGPDGRLSIRLAIPILLTCPTLRPPLAAKRKNDEIPQEWVHDPEIGLARPEPDLRVARPSGQAADTARGAKLAYTCHGCHGIPNYKNAYPIYNVPKLGGQHVAYMVAALKEYKAQDRAHPTMHAQAVTFRMRTWRRYRRRPRGNGAETARAEAVGTAPKAGADLASPAMERTAWASCRSTATWPASTRTTSSTRLRNYKSGVRKNAIMAGMAAALTEKDIKELAEVLFVATARPVRHRRDS